MTNELNVVREAYPSDISDAEWEIMEEMIPPPMWIPNLQEPLHHPREMMNAIRYRTRTACSWPWRQRPHDFPRWRSVFQRYSQWSREGVLETIHNRLRCIVRIAAARDPELTAAILDSQRVKTTYVGGPNGYDAGKK